MQVIDKEVEVNLHRNLRGGPCRWVVIVHLTGDHEPSARLQPNRTRMAPDDLSTTRSLVERGHGWSILTIDNDGRKIDNRWHAFSPSRVGWPTAVGNAVPRACHALPAEHVAVGYEGSSSPACSAIMYRA